MATFADLFGRFWSGAKQDVSKTEDINFPDTLLEKYSILKIIGRGAYGTVYEVTEKKSNGKYALKCIKTKPHTVVAQIKEVINDFHKYIDMNYLTQLELQTNCHDEYVVKIYDHVIWEGHVFSVMELCEGGNLRDWISRHRKYDMINEVVS